MSCNQRYFFFYIVCQKCHLIFLAVCLIISTLKIETQFRVLIESYDAVGLQSKFSNDHSHWVLNWHDLIYSHCLLFEFIDCASFIWEWRSLLTRVRVMRELFEKGKLSPHCVIIWQVWRIWYQQKRVCDFLTISNNFNIATLLHSCFSLLLFFIPILLCSRKTNSESSESIHRVELLLS